MTKVGWTSVTHHYTGLGLDSLRMWFWNLTLNYSVLILLSVPRLMKSSSETTQFLVTTLPPSLRPHLELVWRGPRAGASVFYDGWEKGSCLEVGGHLREVRQFLRGSRGYLSWCKGRYSIRLARRYGRSIKLWDLYWWVLINTFVSKSVLVSNLNFLSPKK